MCAQSTLYSSSVLMFCCFYLHNVHIKECTFVIYGKPIFQVLVCITKIELTNVEIKEQTASFPKGKEGPFHNFGFCGNLFCHIFRHFLLFCLLTVWILLILLCLFMDRISYEEGMFNCRRPYFLNSNSYLISFSQTFFFRCVIFNPPARTTKNIFSVSQIYGLQTRNFNFHSFSFVQ